MGFNFPLNYHLYLRYIIDRQFFKIIQAILYRTVLSHLAHVISSGSTNSNQMIFEVKNTLDIGVKLHLFIC